MLNNDDLLDIKGEILTLDPKSKIVISFLIIIGVSLSIEPFQVLVFFVLAFPLIVFYRPSIRFLRKLLLIFPLLLVFVIVFLSSFKEPVTVHLLWFNRVYSPTQFTLLLTFRLFVSALHTSILIESEPSVFNILEALDSFKLNDFLISILLLINRLATAIIQDYEQMQVVAKTRGGMHGKFFRNISFRFQLMGIILSKNVRKSDQFGDTLTARGFAGKFYGTIRDWTSDGLTILTIIAIFWAITLISPFMR